MAVNGSNGHTGERLVGQVEAVNERGVKLGGQWRNVSKWAEDVAMPSRGQTVALTLDGSGFIRGIAPADTGTGAHQTATAGRETAITRLAVLRTAATFCASRPELKTADLFTLAERMEDWVTR